MRRFVCFSICLATATLIGCGAPYDDQQLAKYRSVLPKAGKLTAPLPSDDDPERAIGESAIYPPMGIGMITAVNGAIVGLIDIVQAIANTEPTLYNSETKEFLWGPGNNDSGVGNIALYIRENPEGGDFKYGYAFLRGIGADVASFTPIIVGAATPDASDPELGTGFILWDFEANRAFEEANDPAFDAAATEQGRFVVFYSASREESATLGLVVTMGRDVVFDGESGEEPADLDMFHGHMDGADVDVSFLDFQLLADIFEEPSAPETLGIRMAFINSGNGRAEATASGGSLDAGESLSVHECWDADLNQTYIRTQATVTAGTWSDEDGELADCGLVFQQTLTDLGVPSLSDIDQEHLDAIENLALHGIQ